jgi:heme exporter protein A
MFRLEAENLAKSFGRTPVFEGLSFSAAPGLLAVTGRNGSGKSTLLKILGGMLNPTRGRARVFEDGRMLTEGERRRAVGWASPEVEFLGELTALENLYFLALAGSGRRSKENLSADLEEIGLGEAADRRVAEFSSGMKQRLRLAFSLVTDPPVLLWDEPYSNLDAEGIEAASRILARRRQRGPVVLATNSRREFNSPDAEISLS